MTQIEAWSWLGVRRAKGGTTLAFLAVFAFLVFVVALLTVEQIVANHPALTPEAVCAPIAYGCR